MPTQPAAAALSAGQPDYGWSYQTRSHLSTDYIRSRIGGWEWKDEETSDYIWWARENGEIPEY